jgi:hypothetical protein
VTHLPLGLALSMGLRALLREAWLAAVGLLVTVLRRALLVPALAVAGLLVLRGAVSAARLAPYSSGAPLAGAFLVASQPRAVALVAGLALAGSLLGGALRLAWLAGALPTLAGALRALPDATPRFADGVANGLPRLLPLLALTWLMELAGAGFALALGLGALRVSGEAARHGPAWLAAPVALALLLAVAVPLGLSILADAALVRAAVRGEGPATALARAAERLVRRPAAFLLGGLAFAAAGLAVAAALSSLGSVATGFAPGAPEALLLGPQLMLAALSATLAAAVELWWLASLTALSTHEG